MKNIVILISGSGSNMAAIIRTAQEHNWAKHLNARVSTVISNKAHAEGLTLAQQHGIATAVVEHKAFADQPQPREAFDAALMAEIDQHQPHLVVLAGFMRILKGDFLKAFEGRVVNIHPSLLPSFPGLEAWKQALNYGVKVTGCTVHWVDQGVDTGPILAQRAVPVLEGDTAASLHQRIQEAERTLYPETLARLTQGPWMAKARPTPGT